MRALTFVGVRALFWRAHLKFRLSTGLWCAECGAAMRYADDLKSVSCANWDISTDEPYCALAGKRFGAPVVDLVELEGNGS